MTVKLFIWIEKVRLYISCHVWDGLSPMLETGSTWHPSSPWGYTCVPRSSWWRPSTAWACPFTGRWRAPPPAKPVTSPLTGSAYMPWTAAVAGKEIFATILSVMRVHDLAAEAGLGPRKEVRFLLPGRDSRMLHMLVSILVDTVIKKIKPVE